MNELHVQCEIPLFVQYLGPYRIIDMSLLVNTQHFSSFTDVAAIKLSNICVWSNESMTIIFLNNIFILQYIETGGRGGPNFHMKFWGQKQWQC